MKILGQSKVKSFTRRLPLTLRWQRYQSCHTSTESSIQDHIEIT